ncbi:MAG: hypothetical protein EA361_08580 [Bacteroidetes bacterium]|nr:MAG: hypothetical protein EA361_08580 [Bacteroidota bacterium]
MKYNRKNWMWVFFISIFLFISCDPNKDLYHDLDEMAGPYNEEIDYTITLTDYDRLGGFMREYNAFSDSFPAKEFVPLVLTMRYPTLLEGSVAQVTFNHFLLYPDWWDAGFGYVFTTEDYIAVFGVTGSRFFYPDNPARNNIPFMADDLFPDADEGDRENVIYDFRVGGETFQYLDVYEFDGSSWSWIETIENLPYVGYELEDADYKHWGTGISQFNRFNENNPPEEYLPSFLRNLLPFAVAGDEQVLRFRYFNGTQTLNIKDKYHFADPHWVKVPYFIEVTEQYIFGAEGWAFDPTISFVMDRADYQYLVDIDPIGQQEFAYADFAYYYGASAFYRNFDIRLLSRRLDKLANGEYADSALAEIFNSEGAEAAVDEMMRRINEEGIIALLQHKYPDATPEVDGIEVLFFVSYETFGDNWTRTNPTVEYRCVAAGTPPQFEIVEKEGE